MAAVSLPTDLPDETEEGISNIFSQLYSPGSTIKIILAAAALSIDPDLASFEYDCTAENHIFHTEEGDYRISCAGNVYHGRMDMTKAIAYSCNGYFISLLQQIPEDELAEELMGEFDLSSLPFILCTDSKGKVTRKYISLARLQTDTNTYDENSIL